MGKGDSVSYKKREAIKEIFPDNPQYEWPEEVKDKWFEGDTPSEVERTTAWFEMLKERFESFEHNPKSSIYKTYAHDYSDPKQRVIKMPNGSTPGGNYNHMQEQLPEALRYRIKNFNKKKKNGWKVFEKITGWYDVEAADANVLVERDVTLKRFLSLLAEDEELARFDPQTGKEAITEIDSSGEMTPIAYMFPMGIEDTDMIHYVVLEPEVIEAKIESEEQILDIMLYELGNYVYNKGETLLPKRSIGIIMGKHSNVLRPHIKFIQESIGEMVESINEAYEEGGTKSLQKMIGKLELPDTQKIVNHDNLIETYKKIGVAPLLKKVKSAALRKRLNRIKPPSEGKSGGVSWPASAGGNYALWITTDPLEMLTKSTGRLWSERNASCENWDGCYAEGPVSDVKYGNCSIWIYKQGEEEYRHEIGRFILRWGEAMSQGTKKGFDIGVESQVYPKDPSQSPWGFNLLNAVGQILKDNGFLDYETCITPYKYQGYSDKAGSGKVKIQYDSRIFLKNRGDVEIGGANALVTMASDENLSYADSGYVINYGNAQALLALAQNPITWIYENTVRRLFTRALDLEEGPQIVRFLLESQVANYDWFLGVLDTLPIFDANYDNPYSMDGYLPFILRNSRCSDEAHRGILSQFEGYELVDGKRKIQFPLAYVAYWDIFHYAWDSPPIITSAPADVLDILTEEVIKKRFMVEEGKVQPDPQLWPGLSNFDLSASRSYNEPLGADYGADLRKYYYKMVAMKHLIFQPKLSLKSFGKLLTEFHALWKRRSENPLKNHFNRTLYELRSCFAIALCFPMSQPNSWGYIDEFESGIGGMMRLGFNNIPANLRNIVVIEDGEEIKYPIYSRQAVGTVRRMVEIFPTLAKINIVQEDSPLLPYEGLLISNIRDSGVFKELMKNPSIPRVSLLNRMCDPEDSSLSIPNPFLNAKNYGQIFLEMFQQGNFEEFEWDYVGFGMHHKQGQEKVVHLRESVPKEAVDMLLLQASIPNTSPTTLKQIGLNFIAQWLRTPEQFDLFEEIVYKMSFKQFYRGKGEFSILEDSDYENPETIILLDEATDDGQQMAVAAFGSYGGIGGLVSNPYLPESLQLKLFTTWADVCDMYNIEYSWFFPFALKRMASNVGISPAMVDFLLQYDGSLIDVLIANAKISIGDNIVQQTLKSDPSVLLKNYNLNIRSYKNIYKDWVKVLKKHFGGDTRRFQNFIERLSIRRLVNPEYDGHLQIYRQVRRLMESGNYPWVRYWRGGTYRKGLDLPSDTNSAPLNVERNRPMALVDEPQLIDYPQIIWTASAEKDEEGNHIFENICLKVIETITQEDDLIRVTGKTYTQAEYENPRDINTTYNSIDELYGYIPRDERENPDIKWRHGIVLVIYDVANPEELRSLPEWRLDLQNTDVMSSLKDYMTNPKLEDDDLIQVCEDWRQGVTINSEADRFSIDLYTCLAIIDDNGLWTPEIVDKYRIGLFNTGNAFRTYNNLSPSAEILELSLSNDENELVKKLSRGLRHMDALQLWIMGEKFEKTLPILYIYECLTSPYTTGAVKDRARAIRDKRLGEFLAFIRRDDDPQVNDAEEMHPVEWRVLSSETGDILFRYCEKIHPNDIVKQDMLMESIIRGDNYVSFEEMAQTIRGD